MLVIHPQDRTTAVLQVLYKGLGEQVVTGDCSNRKIEHLLHHTSHNDRIMLLGHGSDKGLFYRKDDTKNDFDRVIVGHPHAFFLRKHGSNLIGIWCHANMFAQAEGLHGLFSGMMISEKREADEYGVTATQEEILASNQLMLLKLRQLLDGNVSFQEIPEMMKAIDDERTPLSAFNYGNFHYI